VKKSVTFGAKPYFINKVSNALSSIIILPDLVCITGNRSDPLQTEIEQLARETSSLEEWNNEAPQATVHMQTDPVFLSKGGEPFDIVHASIGKVDC
jgi:hypothetical protein